MMMPRKTEAQMENLKKNTKATVSSNCHLDFPLITLTMKKEAWIQIFHNQLSI
jgi:hypothetical protein